jgi:hypothetical protein
MGRPVGSWQTRWDLNMVGVPAADTELVLLNVPWKETATAPVPDRIVSN